MVPVTRHRRQLLVLGRTIRSLGATPPAATAASSVTSSSWLDGRSFTSEEASSSSSGLRSWSKSSRRTYARTTVNSANDWNLDLDPSTAHWRRSLVKASPFSSRADVATKTKSNPSVAAGSESPQQPQQPLFRKVLIANRGEIAVRVARTCRRLGIPTVAVYASNDAKSIHVEACDESVCIGADAGAYTDPDKLLAICRTVGADAVHPGYGFLSEHEGFARAIQTGTDRNKIAWLGPPADAIRDMGCKLRSKELAKKAGVATIPGSDGTSALESVEEALALLADDGSNGNGDDALRYPVLLKAAAGGGGKGMRICRNDRELREGYPLAQSEAQKFFADGRLLLERYLESPHHIEFQVVCSRWEDDHPDNGDAGRYSTSSSSVDVAIFAERECSVQRRNQKVVEESPSCLLTEATRRTMMEQTALLCQAVGYEGAGTVEWLVVDQSNNDSSSSSNENDKPQQEFYFLEMNTRLQVEHPVTEAVSKHPVDLVEAMLMVGVGQGLPWDWYDAAAEGVVEVGGGGNGRMLVMPHRGHSIEGRIYAEDPLRGYLPSTGALLPYKEPPNARIVGDVHDDDDDEAAGSSYLRLDSGVVEGHVVTPFYDPMLSKIISYAPTREEAIEVLSEGLDSYVIEGVRHNARLVQAVLRHPSFKSGKTPTSFLDDEIPDFSEYRYNNNNNNDNNDNNNNNDPAATAMSDDADDNENPTNGPRSLLSFSEEEELAAAVAAIAQSREDLLGRPPAVVTSDGPSKTVVVRLDGLFGPTDAFSVTSAQATTNDGEGDTVRVCRLRADASGMDDTDEEGRVISLGPVCLDLANYLARVTVDGSRKTIQVLREGIRDGSLTVQMHGAIYPNCLVQSPREFELGRHMLPLPLEESGSHNDSVKSPMPGTLLSYAKGVQKGAFVVTGQDLCVVEAMKMQNSLKAPREGTIAALLVEAGSALVTDQIILEFEADAEDDEEEEAASAS